MIAPMSRVLEYSLVSSIKLLQLLAEQAATDVNAYKTPNTRYFNPHWSTPSMSDHTNTYTHVYIATGTQLHTGTAAAGGQQSGRFPRLVVVQYKNRFRYLRMHKTINLHYTFIPSWLSTVYINTELLQYLHQLVSGSLEFLASSTRARLFDYITNIFK